MTLPATQMACRAGQSKTIDIPDSLNPWVPLTFDTVQFDYGGFFNPATQTRLTFPAEGVYHVFSHIQWTNLGGQTVENAGHRVIAFRKNGVDYFDDVARNCQSVSAHAPLTWMSLTTIGYFVAGDYLEVAVFQNSGIPLSIQPSGYESPSFGAALAPILVPQDPTSGRGVDPDFGFTAGGTSVAIRGSGFQSGATVTFGLAPATGVGVANGNLIYVTSPPHAAGAVNVVVTNPDDTGALAGVFTYVDEVPGINVGDQDVRVRVRN